MQGEVSHAEGVDGHSIAVDEHAAVGRDGIAIGVEASVGVVERASVGRIADAFLADEDVLAVHHAHRGRTHIALETEPIRSDGVRPDALAGVVGACLDLDGITLVGEGAGIEGLGFDGRTVERCALGGDVLDGEGRAISR